MSMKCIHRRFIEGVAGIIVCGTAAAGQIVVGTVRDGAGNAVPLVHVFASDSVATFSVSVGTLTDRAGHFVLHLGTPSRFVAARRIGYAPEAPVALRWNDADTVRLDIVLRALPYELPTVYAGSSVCLRGDSLPASSDVRRLWEGAVATTAAREAFMNGYHFALLARIHAVANGKTRDYDTTSIPTTPVPPLSGEYLDRPLATYRAATFWHRTIEFHIATPDSRVFAHPQFFRRFCFDDEITRATDGAISITFAERTGANGEVEVLGTMTFRDGLPGPSRVAWRYVAAGKTIGHAEQNFAQVDVDGSSFPLPARNWLELLDPRTGVRMTYSSADMKYVAFTRIAP